MQYQNDLFKSGLDNDTHITTRSSSSVMLMALNVLCSHNQASLHISISFACMYTLTLLESYLGCRLLSYELISGIQHMLGC